MLRVRNPLHGTQYLVFLPEYPSRESALCTCPDFARRARGTCKHLEGAVRFLAGRPVEPPRPRAPGRPAVELWEAIDRARAVDAGNPPTLRALRATGALLYEESEGPTPARTTSGRTK